MAIKKNFLVEKRNVLNELRRNSMSLQELRFFSIYLSKINARDISTRNVIFSLDDFCKIMEIGKVNIWRMKQITDGLLCKIVHLDTPDGGYKSFQLFKECNVFQNELSQWQVEIDAHDKALPLMFEFKDKYFTYELWNSLRLKSGNQLRMYEILKQYEKIGERTIPIDKLKELLGLNSTQYPQWNNFKLRILDSCQQALQESTDICFTYEPIKVGRKFTGVRFFILKNESYVDQLMLDEFIGIQTVADEVDPDGVGMEDDNITFLSGACKDEFDISQMEQIQTLLYQLSPDKLPPMSGMPTPSIDFQRYHYLMSKYANFCRLATQHGKSGDPIKNRFSYFLITIQADLVDS